MAQLLPNTWLFAAAAATIVTSLLRAHARDARGSLPWAPMEGQTVPEAVTHQAEPSTGKGWPRPLHASLCWETAGPFCRTEN